MEEKDNNLFLVLAAVITLCVLNKRPQLKIKATNVLIN